MCMGKCIRRIQDQSQKVLDLNLNCYELSRSTDRRPHGPLNYVAKTLLTISPMKAKYMKQTRLLSSMPSILI